jgi:HPt (histidine-containing phosphotransfer) domain-containing protein
LAHHLTAGDFDAIGHVTHSLKGLAGTLGAVRLEQAALESEKSVRQHKSATEIEVQLKPTITALTDLLKALDTIFAQKNEPPETMLVDRSQAPSVMEQLEYYLSCNDASANNYFDQFKTLLTACLGSAAEIIGRQIDDFDYADALTTLRAAREKGFVEADHPRLSDAAPKE